MMELEWPWVLLLLPLPLLLRRYSATAAPETTAEAIEIPRMMETALDSLPVMRGRSLSIRQLLACLAWLCLLLAIAQPTRPGNASVQPVSGRALALAIDISGSMERQDFVLDGEAVTRLALAKQITGDFIARRQGDRLSLILFARQAFIASPLTFDLEALRHFLNVAEVGMAGRSTAIGDALGLAMQSLRHDPAPNKAIILLSDGTNNAGSVEPESAAALADSLNMRIHTIALGSLDGERSGYRTAQSADLDEATLQAVASAATGHFFRASDSDTLTEVYAVIDELERAEVEAPPVVLREDLAHWPMLMLLVCLLMLCQRWPVSS